MDKQIQATIDEWKEKVTTPDLKEELDALIAAGDEDKLFDAFYRSNPMNSGYAICAGVQQVIEYIKELTFTDDDITYLRSLGIFGDDFLDYLKTNGLDR